MSNSDFRKVRTDEKVRELAGSGSLSEMKSLSLEGSEITNATIELLALNCFELKELTLTETMITDQGLQLIGKLPSLNWLVIDSENATDQGLRRVVTLPALKGLHLIDTKLSEDGFASLKSLQNLVYLEVVTNDIGEDGLRSITDKAGLEYLRLSVANVDEEKFSGLILGESLQSFTFEMPLVEDKAVEELQKKFPACSMNRYRFQRSEDQSEYEAAMRASIERSPVPVKQIKSYERYLHSVLSNTPQPDNVRPTSPLTLSGKQPTGWLSPAEVAMLIERGLLDPDFYKYNRVFASPNKRS